jgi:hypothetical protein
MQPAMNKQNKADSEAYQQWCSARPPPFWHRTSGPCPPAGRTPRVRCLIDLGNRIARQPGALGRKLMWLI